MSFESLSQCRFSADALLLMNDTQDVVLQIAGQWIFEK
jgi:hypothetical protein